MVVERQFEGRQQTFFRGDTVDVIRRKPLPEWRYHERHGGGTIEGEPDTKGSKNRFYGVRCRCGELYQVRVDNLVPKHWLSGGDDA